MLNHPLPEVDAVATFYLLPSRPALGAGFADYLEGLFPGLSLESSAWAELADTLGAVAARRPDTYVVYREELPEGTDPVQALADGFGAEPGDEIIEVRPGATQGQAVSVHWQLGGNG